MGFGMATLEPFRLERYFAKYEFQAKYLASSSDAESLHVRDLLAYEPSAEEALRETWLGYSDSTGLEELRREISATYTSISPEQVLTHVGAEEPIFNFFHACLRPGDHVVVHCPSYQSLASVPKSLGCEVTRWEARFENGWAVDFAELERALRPNTRAVVVNVPHNPTGFLFTAEEQKRLVDLLRTRGILLFSDEVYRGIEMKEETRLPAACDLYENAVSLGVLSKAYGLAGLRVGWIATRNSDVLARMAAQKDYTTICSPSVTERLGCIAVRNREAIIGRNCELVRANWKLAAAFFAKHSDLFEVVPPRGGTMAFPRARNGFDVKAFTAFLLERESVMLLGGEFFEMPGRHFRLGLGRKDFPVVLSILERGLPDFAGFPV
jgi:aspartate/methionine/tyrosine aminotransferase